MTNFFNKGTKFYRQSLLIILAIAALPSLLLSSIIYWGAGREIEQELHQLHHQKINERAQTIDDILAQLELQLGHWAFEPQFDYMLGDTDFSKDFQQAWDITQTLIIIQSTSELIERAELYLSAQNGSGILFNPEHGVVQPEEVNQQYAQLLQRNASIYWTNDAIGGTSGHAQQQPTLALIRKVPGNSSEPIGFLMVRINMDKLAQLVNTMTPYNGAKTLVVGQDGEMIISTGVAREDEALIQNMIGDIHNPDKESSLYFEDWKGTRYSISYGHFNRILPQWAYISAAPIHSITTPLLSISKFMIIVSLVGVLLTITIAWLASKRIYSPIGKLVRMLSGDKDMVPDKRIDEFSLINQRWQDLNRENKALQTKLKRELPNLKESFLQQLIQGYLYRYSSSELIDRFSQYGGKAEQAVFTVIFVQLLGFSNLVGRFYKGDEGLVTFAAYNIAEELAGDLDQTHVINFHDLSIAILVAESGSSRRERVYGLCCELTQAINELLRMRATVVISPATEDIKQIAALFDKTKAAIRHRSFDSENQILDMEETELLAEPGSMNYPFAIERALIQALRAGEQDEAMRQLVLFVESISVEGTKEIDVQQGMMQLLAGILNAVSQVGINPAALTSGINVFEALSQIRDSQSIIAWFNEHIIASCMRELEKRTNDQVKRIVERASFYLQEHYAKDISLESCADHTGVTPHFLSKVFKSERGINFIEYLTALRMDKAKALLKETDIMINEIANLVGYQPSYFIRLFKKLEGVTPGRFRELARSKEQ